MNRENQSDEILTDILKTADEIDGAAKKGVTMDTKKPSDYELQWLREGRQFERSEPITDTSKLVVGQDVWLSSVGHGFIEGKVVKVTPEGVDVQTTGQGSGILAHRQPAICRAQGFA